MRVAHTCTFYIHFALWICRFSSCSAINYWTHYWCVAYGS